MNCPHCSESLTMTERNGVEIDYCPKCRGVWLDRGELDKIIERSAQFNAQPPVREESRHAPRDSAHDKYFARNDSQGHHDEKHGKHGKKKSWLGDVFDF